MPHQNDHQVESEELGAKTSIKPNIFVLYHAHCNDGLGAAFAAYKKFGESAEYIPVSYGKGLPEMDLDSESEVYILDFSFGLEDLKTLTMLSRRVLVIDHHKTAYERFTIEVTKEFLSLKWPSVE